MPAASTWFRREAKHKAQADAESTRGSTRVSLTHIKFSTFQIKIHHSPHSSLQIYFSLFGFLIKRENKSFWCRWLIFSLPLQAFPQIQTNNAMTMSNGDSKTSTPFRIFVGYDPREDLAYKVCHHSITKRSSIPVEITPIVQSDLRERGLYWRERNNLESTEFSFTRFLTPHLSDYQGWAMFVDCDFLYIADIKELVDLIDDKYAIMCVQHDYTPKETTKMDGAVQTVYPRKNWSSMVLYNCGHPKNKTLTPEAVNTQSGAFLHRFQWLEDEEIGSVPFVWNFLEGHNRVVENDPATQPKAVHFTRGGPWFDAWKNCDFADLWLGEMEEYSKENNKDAN
ncbi:hypothetical protein BRARA_B01604 [Brassica rapa]|uniref:Nucleotide-diphospho-sugar transferase domain-containing protein n=1 Tax=Brassica campestris TaxID=3711 RepID=A0A398ACC5_BRACM|nr:hypothetical protein BRARA_B01604 [Brassica rapa]